MPKIESTEAASVFEHYEYKYQQPLYQIRDLIFEAAEQIAPEETIVESLKWNQPSYTAKNASPIRIDRFEKDKIAVFFNCQTTLVETFREEFSDTLQFSKNRAIVLDPEEELPIEELSYCIKKALTYHKK